MNGKSRTQDLNVSQARDGVEKEMKEMSMAVAHIDENAAESEAEIETSVVHLMTDTEAKMLKEVQTKIDMKIVAVVQLINIATNHHLAHEETDR